MRSEHSTNEKSLKDEVGQSERVLLNFEQDLREVDAELQALAEKNHQYELLSQICSSLEELGDLGATNLFWDGQSSEHDPAEHIQHALRRVDDYGEEISRVNDRREEIIARIGKQNLALDTLHYDLRDAIEREESRRNEWHVENNQPRIAHRAQIMPWARGTEEDDRFRRSLAASILVSLFLGLMVSWINLPILEREAIVKVPERVARLVREERAPPPPPVEEQIIPKEELQEPELEPQLAEEQPPEDSPKVTEETVVAQTPEPDTREQVKTKGILAFRESFANRASIRPSAQLGSHASLSNAGDTAVGRPERSMVTTSAPGSSGGINLADISRNVGGGGQGIEGVQLATVASSIGGAEGSGRPLSGGVYAGRTDEEIQIVFDRYKAALYRLYNRALRQDPTLRGQMILRLTIEPDGSVSLCQLQSSDMDAPTLSDQIVGRVSSFDFGAKEDIVAMTIIYPIDFLPAA